MLPPVLAGSLTPENRERVEQFFFSVPAIFEAWVGRRNSEHTRRAYRGDVMAFIRFMKWQWPDEQPPCSALPFLMYRRLKTSS